MDGQCEVEIVIRDLLAIAVGGAIGAVSRYLAAEGVKRLLGQGFPWGILIVNVAGCFLIGLAVEFSLSRREVPIYLQRGFIIGFLGGLTTFSSFGHDTFRLLESGRNSLAIGNMASNMVVGLFAVWLGVLLGRALFPVTLPT